MVYANSTINPYSVEAMLRPDPQTAPWRTFSGLVSRFSEFSDPVVFSCEKTSGVPHWTWLGLAWANETNMKRTRARGELRANKNAVKILAANHIFLSASC